MALSFQFTEQFSVVSNFFFFNFNMIALKTFYLKIASSNYFHALFTNGMSDTNNKTVLIHNVESENMRSIIGKN
jgi:hypothetical protein